MRGIAIYAAIAAIALVLFLFAPQIDLAAARLFYAAGQGFPMSDWLPIAMLYDAVPWMTWGILTLVGGGDLALAL
jgi:hypothetical protein